MAFRKIKPFLVITLLCIAAVFAFYRLVEHRWLRPGVVSSGMAINSESGPGGRHGESPGDYRIILERNLFGIGPARAGDAGSRNNSASGSALAAPDLLLVGTVAGNSRDRRAVILETATGKQRLVGVGDTVKGAVIKDIEWDKVVLHYPERDEVLDMAVTRRYFSEVEAHRSLLERASLPPSAALRSEQDRPQASFMKIMPSRRRFSIEANSGVSGVSPGTSGNTSTGEVQ